jgi:hypothetical protein
MKKLKICFYILFIRLKDFLSKDEDFVYEDKDSFKRFVKQSEIYPNWWHNFSWWRRINDENIVMTNPIYREKYER